MKITDLFSKTDLMVAVADGFVRMQSHPTKPLVIFNYTEKAQFAREWNDVTRNCRGLIVNTVTDEVVARPFPKFFNYGELTDLDKVKMSGPLSVTEKMDGSLGIVYFDGDEWSVATRGSFTSDQAKWATKRLRETIIPHLKAQGGDYERFNLARVQGITHLVEIIYPENRIVVDYEGAEYMPLLATIDNSTGNTLGMSLMFEWPDDLVETHDFRSFLDVAAAPDRRNHEGYVVLFVNSNLRVKIKHDEYVALHKLVTGVNERVIWEYMRDKVDYSKVYEIVPDEVYGWVEEVVGRLQEAYVYLQAEVAVSFDEIEYLSHDRKAFAEKAKATPYPGAMFSLLDGRDIDTWLWDQIKPEAIKPWVGTREEVAV